MVRRIKHNNLLPWFTEDHGTLPAAYVKSCQKFFDELKAASRKRQAVAVFTPGKRVKNRFRRNI
jgi:hypothetical protein